MATCFFNTPECTELNMLVSHNSITIGEPIVFYSGKYKYLHFDVSSSNNEIVLSVFLKYKAIKQAAFIGGEIMAKNASNTPLLQKHDFESIENIGKYIINYF